MLHTTLVFILLLIILLITMVLLFTSKKRLSPRHCKSILFTNARNEKNILEWVVHHLHLGFSHIFITDHHSTTFLSTLLRKLPPERLTVVRQEGEIRKGDLMKKAVLFAKRNKYDWMIYLDADEFLYLAHHDTISDFLEDYRSYDQVGINWLLFGSNEMDSFPSGTLLEHFTKSSMTLDQHIKSFLNVQRISQTHIHKVHPHVYFLKDMRRSVACDHMPLNKDTPYWYPNDKSIDSVPAFLAHYYSQSYDRFLSRKIHLRRDDTNEYRTIIPRDEFHKMYNDMDCFLVVEKYNARNIKSIKKYRVEEDHVYTP